MALACVRNHAGVTSSIHSRAVAKAAELLGGRAELARVLEVAHADVERWITTDEKPPREVFLRVVDIILDETAGSGPGDAPETPPGRQAAGPSRYLD